MLKKIGSNWIISFVSIGVTYILTPFLIRTLGTDGYGTWTLMTSITGYLSLLALGVPLASVRYFTKHIAEGDRHMLNKAISSCTGLYILIGACAMVIGIGMFIFFNMTYDIPSLWQSEARIAFFILVLWISAGFIGFLPEGIMLAHQDFVIRNLIRLIILLIRFGLILLLLTFFQSLFVLACIQLVCLIIEFLIAYFVIRCRYEGLRINLAYFDWSMVRRIISFSLYVLMLNMGVYLSFYTDSMVIGAFLDVNQIPFYSVANSLLVYLLELIIAIAAVVLPTATKLHTEGRMSDLREIFLKWSKITISITLLIGLFLIVLGPRFIGWWINSSFEGPGGRVLQILMVSSFLFMPIRGVAQPMLMGLGKVGLPTIAFLLAGILNLLISLVLVSPWGLKGVAVGTAIPTGLFSLFMMIFACRQLEVSLLTYIRYVLLRPILGSLPVLALLLWFRMGFEVSGLVGLASAGVTTVVVFVIIWIFFVFKGDPYVRIDKGFINKVAWRRG